MITLCNINKFYNNKGLNQIQSLKNINLKFNLGEFIAIVGYSGAGKTTLLNILGGLDKYDTGDLIIDNISTKEFKDKDWVNYRKNKVGFVFQNINLISNLTALENVELALMINGMSKEERVKKAMDALEKVGLADQADKKPGYMSGGEQQRVAIARAIVNNPDILLADEPTGQLDNETAKEILELLKKIGRNKLVIVVTHMKKMIKEYASRIIEISDGEIVKDENINNKLIINNKVQVNTNNQTIKMFDLFKYAFKNTILRLRFTITLLFIIILCVQSIMLLLGVGLGINNKFNDMLKEDIDIGKFIIDVNNPDGDLPFFKDQSFDYEEIRNIIFDTSLVPIVEFNIEENINEQLFLGRGGYMEIATWMLPNDNSYNKLLTIGNIPKNKNEILMGRNTAINLLYLYYEKKGLDVNIILTANDNQIFSLINNVEITFFTEHEKNLNELRYQTYSFYLQPVQNLSVVGLINDNKIEATHSYSNIKKGIYYPRIFVNKDLFYEIINQYNDKPIDKDILEYYRPSSFVVEVQNDHNIRNNAIKYILDEYPHSLYFHGRYDNSYSNLLSFKLFVLFIGVSFSAIIFILFSIILNGILYNNMKKRKKEFGVIFSLGMSNKQLKKLLILEGIFISLFGVFISYIIASLIGLKLNESIINIINILFENQYNLKIFIIPWYMLIFLVLFITYSYSRPVKKIAKLNIVEALREE